ncbi:MAG: hypothetical protein ABJD07_17410, partial [Gemmatimonadaceae bacterium]
DGGAREPVTISLEPRAAVLAPIAVTAARIECAVGGFADATLAPAAGVLMEEAALNAERARLFVRTYPMVYRFVVRTEFRTDRDIWTRLRIDTIAEASLSDWRYRPGTVVYRGASPNGEIGPQMHVPELADVADTSFQRHHCFRYAGRDANDSTHAERIDFVPTSDVRAPDIEGSLYLDSRTFLLRRATFRLTRAALLDVEVSYREIYPGIVVLERIIARQGLGVSPQLVATIDRAAGLRGAGLQQRDGVVLVERRTSSALTGYRFLAATP